MTRNLLAAALAVLCVLCCVTRASAQATYTWDPADTTGSWLTPGSWTGGPAGTWPGVTAVGGAGNGNAGDTAVVGDFAFPQSTGLMIDMAAAGGELSLGALQFTGSTANLIVRNPSTTAGNLRLNGATVAGISNVILANTSGSRELTIVGNMVGTSTQNFGVQLGNTSSVILANAGRQVNVSAVISEVNANSGVAVNGGGTVVFSGANTYTGSTTIQDGSSLVLSGGNNRLNPTTRVNIGGGAANNRLVLGDALGPVNQTLASINAVSASDRIVGGNAAISTLTLTSGVDYTGFLGGAGTNENNLALTINSQTVNGVGLYTIRSPNTYTGGTSILRGQVVMTDYAALGPGTVTITPTGGYAELGVLTVASGSVANAVVVNAGTGEAAIGSQNINGMGAPPTVFDSPITLNGPVTLVGGNQSPYGVIFKGPITGTGDVKVVFRVGLNYVVTLDRASGAANQFGNVLISSNSTLRLGGGNVINNRTVPDTSSITLQSGARLQLAPTSSDNEAVNALISAPGLGVIETVAGSGTSLFNLSVGAGNGSGTYGGIIQEGGGLSQIVFNKVGTGTQTLAGASTYRGGTNVRDGTLQVTNTTGSALGFGLVQVLNGGTLGGTGRVFTGITAPNPVRVLNGGTLQAGGTDTAAPTRNDTLNLASGLDFNGAITLKSTVGQSGGVGSAGKVAVAGAGFSLDAPGPGDLMTIRLTNDGTLDLSGNSTYTVTVLTYNSLTNLTTFTNQTAPQFFAVAAENFTFSGSPLISLNGGNLTVTFTPVPEPTTTLAVATVAGLLLCRRLGRRDS